MSKICVAVAKCERALTPDILGGGSKISQELPDLLFGNFFEENCMRIREIGPRELECAYLAVPPPVRAANDSEINSELNIQRISEGSPESTEIAT